MGRLHGLHRNLQRMSSALPSLRWKELHDAYACTTLHSSIRRNWGAVRHSASVIRASAMAIAMARRGVMRHFPRGRAVLAFVCVLVATFVALPSTAVAQTSPGTVLFSRMAYDSQ